MLGTLPAFFHSIPVLFYDGFQATKPPGLFLKSAPTLEHSSFSRPLSITESVAGRRLVLLGTYAVTLQFSALQNNPLLHSHSETGYIRLRQHSLHHKFRKLRLHTFVKQTPRPTDPNHRWQGVISNLEVDRLREVDVAKAEEKRQPEAARAASGSRGGGRGSGRMGQRGGAVVGS